MNGKAASLALLAVCQIATMALWFSATAVIPSLQAEFSIGPAQASLLTSAVQLGFVFGTLTSAILGLADSLDSRRFFMLSALVATAATPAILGVDPTATALLALRFPPGARLPGASPPATITSPPWARLFGGRFLPVSQRDPGRDAG